VPYNASSETEELCKQIRIFSRIYSGKQNLNDKVPEVYRDAFIYGRSWIFIDTYTGNCFNLKPWQ